MTHLKRIAALLVLVVVGIATRLVVTYGLEGALDAVLQRDTSAHVASAAATHKPAGKPGAAARAAVVRGAASAPAGAAPAASTPAPTTSAKSNVAAVAGPVAPAPATGAALMPSGPLGAGPKAAARNAAAATNAQIAEETGQSVPDIAGRAAPAPAPAPAPVQQGVPAMPAPVASAHVASAPVPAHLAMTDSSSITREMFEYKRDSRRDPFISLMTTNDLRPTLSDLQLTGILYDLSGRRPVAILRDVVGGQWRVTTGMTLGRMRVQQIKPKTIIFTIEEFGFNRQDSLVLGDTTHARSR